MKKPAKTDIAVLILFFNRPECLSKVFAEVKKARPSRLFLYQDGPRGDKDMPGIEACRKVVDDIDWECDVRRNYQTVNAGCDPSNYNAQRWAFSLADKCMVFEDDSIPSQSFFPFCKELLDRYEDDERIAMIAGFNTDEVTTDIPYDYFFTSVFAIWGWASWRRVIDKWDSTYAFLDDETAMSQLNAVIKQRRYIRNTLKACYNHRSSGKEYYETIFWSAMVLNNQLAIMPTRNMINNLGPMAVSTHYEGSLDTTPRALRRLFTMKRYDVSFPLRHPRYVLEHLAYKERYDRIAANGHPWIKIGRSLEELVLNLRHGNLRHIAKSIRHRIRIWMGKKDYK